MSAWNRLLAKNSSLAKVSSQLTKLHEDVTSNAEKSLASATTQLSKLHDDISSNAQKLSHDIKAQIDSLSTEKKSSVSHSDETIHVVIIGAGPVGLYMAKELKKRDPKLGILMIERFEKYTRHHFVKVERHFLDTKSHSHKFFALASSFTPLAYSSTISATKTMSILDLENIWRQEVISLGIQIIVRKINDPISLENEYPNARIFVGADGSKSVVRTKLFGNEKSLEKNLQYMVELKYKVVSNISQPEALSDEDLFKTRKLLHFYVTEFVRGDSDVIIRFLVDKDTYDALPGDCTFSNPFLLNTDSASSLPTKLEADIRVILNVRRAAHGECIERTVSATVTKTSLGIYKSSLVARAPSTFCDINNAGDCITTRAHWFLIGDAAMGVPFFRSLNAGLEAATKLIDMCTDLCAQVLGVETHGLTLAVTRHNTFYSVISFREASEAIFKSEGIGSVQKASHVAGMFDHVTQMAVEKTGMDPGYLPSMLSSWTADEAARFKTMSHVLLNPDD